MSTAQSGAALSPFHRFPFIIGNIRIPFFFKFTQNPNEIKISSDKEFKETRTISGYVYEHWGKKPATMSGKVLIKKDSSLTNLIGLNTKSTNLELEDVAYNAELSTFQTLYNLDQRKLIDTELTDKISSITTHIATAVGAMQNAKTILTAGSGIASALLTSKGKESTLREPDQASLEGYLNTLTDTVIIYKGIIYSGFFTKFSYEEKGDAPFYNEVSFEFKITNTTEDWLDTQLATTSVGRGLAAVWGGINSATTIASMLSGVFGEKGKDTNGHV